ncbi:Flavin-dependent monooxygenase like protein [Verticillium longisporum]|nr:Flavin-dependent monooxygenase like protein [Verticillium longisporum]
MTASQDTAVPPAMGPKIAIIGAGPAGCMLARLLHRANVSVTVFESEASLDFRSQGGTLDLHTSTGLLAMKEAGLWDEFLEHARYDGQYIAWVDRHARQHFVMGASSARSDVQERPEIDRAQLRRILAASLPEGMIKWDHRLRRVEAPNTLVFDKLTTSDFDLVVGAEGAWSKVRKFVKPDVDPTYTGIGLYELSIPNASVTAPELYQLVNRGSVFGHADGKRLSIQQMGDGSLNVYVSSLKDGADWMRPEKCGHDTSDLAAAKEALMEEYRDWDSTITDAILKPQGACKTRSLYMLPAGFRWEHHRGVTVIGDAAHLMGPFAGGGGVNVALEDAMRLAASIIAAAQNTEDGKETLDRQVDAFEKDMFPRMEKVQRLTDELMHDYFHTPGVPQSIMARVLTRHVKLSTPAVLHPLATLGVHGYLFWNSLASRWR